MLNNYIKIKKISKPLQISENLVYNCYKNPIGGVILDCPLLTNKKVKVKCFNECPFSSKEEDCPFINIKGELEDIEDFKDINNIEEELEKELGIVLN